MTDSIATRTAARLRQPQTAAGTGISHANLFEDLKASQRAQRGRKTLGHAIEYLTYDLEGPGKSSLDRNARLQAVKILMALNREIYLECEAAPKLGMRCLSWIRTHAL